VNWQDAGPPPQPRPLHRRFGTSRIFQCIGGGCYAPLTPLGMHLTRDGGKMPMIERRRAEPTRSRRAGWWVTGPPSWDASVAFDTARDAAQWLDRAIRDHDRAHGGLADP
jgi:hypothetical protein